jgi:hypothetical protein
MASKTKIMIVTAALIAAFAAPSFAQAQGRPLIEGRNSAIMTPGFGFSYNQDSPAATGGGSTGYNGLVQSF